MGLFVYYYIPIVNNCQYCINKGESCINKSKQCITIQKMRESCIKSVKPVLFMHKIKNFLGKGGKSVTKQFHINIEKGKSVFFSPCREKNQKIHMRAYFAFGKSNPLREDFRQEEGSFCHYLTL